MGLTPNPAQAGFYLRRQMASCVLCSKFWICSTKQLAPVLVEQGEETLSEVGVSV